MTSGKSRTSFQDKLTKQNEMNRLLLVRELSKLKGHEKSDIRMLDTARQRFRSRYKKLGIRASSSGSEAYDVRMYETHNPGFCYHCTGAIKESVASLKSIRETPEDSYEVVRRMLLTNGEVDIDKILCLHLLTAQVAKDVDAHVSVLEASSSILDKGKRAPLTGAWNNLLPCYIVEIERDSDSTNHGSSTDHSKLHHDPRHVFLENETVRNFEKCYEHYARNNADIASALTANDRLARVAPRTLGKMPIISPHVYSLLGASHELRVKQAIAEGCAGKRYHNRRSNEDLVMLDGRSIADSFRLLDGDDEDDDKSASKISPDVSERGRSSGAGFSKVPGNKSNSRRSALASDYKIDRSITMLKGKPKRPVEELINSWRTSEKETTNDLVTIKPSYRIIVAAASKTSSTKSPFRVMQNARTYSVNSFDSLSASPRYSIKKYRKSVYVNSPLKSFALRNEEYRTVKILVNYQIQALVHSVLDVLENVNAEKLQRIVETARDSGKIREIFGRQDIQDFLGSLIGQPLVSSPNSFVVSAATAVHEIDTRLEGFLEDELIATTLELPATTILEILMEEIRDNIIMNRKKKSFAATVELTDERSKVVASSPMSTSQESKSVKLTVENERPISSGDHGATFHHKIPVRRKSEEFVLAANERENKLNERVQVLDWIDKLEGKSEAKKPGKIRNKITLKDLTNKKSGSPEDKAATMVANSLPNERSQFKPQKATQDPGYLDPDRVILRRMTNEQRILVGRMCAALKNRRINNEGLIRERTPLAALITPVLSRESIKMLTRGTAYANKSVETSKFVEEKEEEPTVARTDRLTGPVLAKVRRDIAQHETKRRLDDFFANV